MAHKSNRKVIHHHTGIDLQKTIWHWHCSTLWLYKNYVSNFSGLEGIKPWFRNISNILGCDMMRPGWELGDESWNVLGQPPQYGRGLWYYYTVYYSIQVITLDQGLPNISWPQLDVHWMFGISSIFSLPNLAARSSGIWHRCLRWVLWGLNELLGTPQNRRTSLRVQRIPLAAAAGVLHQRLQSQHTKLPCSFGI